VFELVAAISFPDRERTRQLRRRYLTVILDGLRTADRDPFPGGAADLAGDQRALADMTMAARHGARS
jgi:hypothetical protein